MPEPASARHPAGNAVRGRARLLALAAVGLTALYAAPQHTAPLIVWNASPSSPRGLYLVVDAAAPEEGSYVVAMPPPAAADLAAARDYLPRGLPLVKTMVAGAGALLCWNGDRLVVDGVLSVAVLRADASGRQLPRRSGCSTLGADELLLLGLGDPASYDGRYFGPVDRSAVLGVGILLWSA